MNCLIKKALCDQCNGTKTKGIWYQSTGQRQFRRRVLLTGMSGGDLKRFNEILSAVQSPRVFFWCRFGLIRYWLLSSVFSSIVLIVMRVDNYTLIWVCWDNVQPDLETLLHMYIDFNSQLVIHDVLELCLQAVDMWLATLELNGMRNVCGWDRSSWHGQLIRLLRMD